MSRSRMLGRFTRGVVEIVLLLILLISKYTEYMITFSCYTGEAFTTGSQTGVSSGLSFSQAKSQNFDPFADLANLGSGLPGKILLLRAYT